MGRRTSNGRHWRGGIPSRGLFLSLSLIPARMRRVVRRINRAGLLVILGAIAMAGSGLAIASHGDNFIDLASAPGATVPHDGALFVQGGVGAGTGTFDPFVTANAGGSADTESAITICDDPGCPSPEFDTFTGGGRTHELNLAAVPELEVDGTLYREFSLDANDQGADDFMSIDDIQILLDTQPDAAGFQEGSGSFSTDTGDPAYRVFHLDEPILMRSQTFTPGSGVSDITVLIPTTTFTTAEDCSYGSMDCEHYVYFYFHAGGFDPSGYTLPDNLQGKDWNVTSGFEEWRTRLLPVVDVSKSATPAFDRQWDWTVAKEVSLSGTGPWSDSETVNLFDGQSDTVYWRINVDKGDPIDSNPTVSGTITIHNPTGSELIDSKIPAEINSVEDVIDLGGADIPGDADCGVDYPHTLAAGDTLVCTYDANLSDTTSLVNTATVNIDDDIGGTKDYTATADVDFTSVSPTETDGSADLTDELLSIDETITADVVDRVESQSVSCGDDEGTITNTAVVTESDSADTDQDSAAVTVNCYQLSVGKDAAPTFDRTYDWDVTKTVSVDGGTTWVDAASVDLFAGDAVDVTWKVAVTKGVAQDSNYGVTGTITVDNPAPIAANGVSVSDEIDGVGAAAVDCDPLTVGDQTTVDIGAGGSAQCTYSSLLPDATTRTNTATATLEGVDYTGTYDIDFTGVTPSETDETVDVTDTYAGVLGQLTATPPDPYTHQYTYSRTVNGSDLECGDNHVSNTATFMTNDTATQGSDDADVLVTVICQTGQGCTPGFWQGGVGFDMWNQPDDLDFSPPGGNGAFAHDVLFNDWFTAVPSLDGLTLIDLVGTGGGRNPARKAARSLTAAYLNALADGVNYDYTTAELEAMWDDAAANGTFLELHTELDAKNNLGADLCGFPIDEEPAPLEASGIGMALIALLVALVTSAGLRGRHLRRDGLLDE